MKDAHAGAQHDLLQGAHWAHYTNIILGVWLLTRPASLGYLNADALSHVDTLRVTAAPWVLLDATRGTAWIDLAVGAALIILSLPRGPVEDHYGGWDRYVI